MKKLIPLILVFIGMGVLVTVPFRWSDVQTVTINVPEMAGTKDVRIVTNAALDEVVGSYDGVRNDFEVDLAKKIILYHESQRLLTREYQRQIEARIAEIGFNSRVLKAELNPPPLTPTSDGYKQLWPDRFTAVISAPDMVSTTDANVIVDAITYARLGADDPRICVDEQARRLMIRHESMSVARRNIEYAIACVGFRANDVPACLGRADSIPHGWTPVQL